MNLTINEVISATHGKPANALLTSNSIVGVSTDSRNIKKGELFIPLIGETFDGHDYIKMAEEKSAIAALWQKDRPIPDDLSMAIILVDNTLLALQDLAKYYRDKINPTIIGVTGSNGKTTTKDLIYAILTTKYNVHKTKGNLNNHIGVPLTILAMEEGTEVAIIEMGMSGLGEISLLSKIAKPDIAVITNIGESHLEFLNTRENIAKAKLEIIDGLRENGFLILNGDEPLLRTKINRNYNVGFLSVWVGKNQENDVYPKHINMDDFSQIIFEDNQNNEYKLPLLGMHNVINALMAIEVGKKLNLEIEQIKEGLLQVNITGMRLERIKAKNGSLLLNDAYNASPTSMKAAIRLLSSIKQYKSKIAVLGDMLELGEKAEFYHKEIGKICVEENIDILIATGKFGKWIYEGAKEKGMNENSLFFKNLEAIPHFLLQLSDENSVILIKGSRGVRLEKIIDEMV